MAGQAEAHFERVKAATDQQALALADPAEVVVGPWIRPCGDPGPYAIAAPTPTRPGRLRVLTCTRPEGHGGLFHQSSDHCARVLASWHRDGRPNFPQPITQKGATNA